MEQLNRYKGSLLGLAVGDALGTTLEFRSPGTFEKIDDMVGGGPFNLPQGAWTDDTSMALCLAESLIECRGFDARDQMNRYVKWLKEGYLSSIGYCFDIGGTVLAALEKYRDTDKPYSGSTDPRSAGNGSIMRLAPVPLFYADNMKVAVKQSIESSRTTHQAEEVIEACKLLGGLIVGAINGVEKEELLSIHFVKTHKLRFNTKIKDVAYGSYKELQPPVIKGSGYVVKSLEAALWAFYNSQTFKEGALLAVNLGDDADTTGAVYGQIAGGYYGVDSIPEEWLTKLVEREKIEGYANDLFFQRSKK